VRNFFIKISNSQIFEMFILVCIVLNTAVLACAYYQMPQELIDAFEKVNYTFMAIFTVEAIIKLIA
jgi:CHASE3 domain sensor protein